MTSTIPCLNPRRHQVVNHLAGSTAATECQQLARGGSGRTATASGVPASAVAINRATVAEDPTQRVWPVELFEQEPQVKFVDAEQGLRGNPMMVVSYPGAEDRSITFVADDGRGGRPDNKDADAFYGAGIVQLVTYTDDDNLSGVSVDDYVLGGQGNYGSDPIGYNKAGTLTYSAPGFSGGRTTIAEIAGEEPLVTNIEGLSDPEQIDDFGINVDTLASDGRRIDSYVLPALLKHDEAAAWLRKHASADTEPSRSS